MVAHRVVTRQLVQVGVLNALFARLMICPSHTGCYTLSGMVCHQSGGGTSTRTHHHPSYPAPSTAAVSRDKRDRDVDADDLAPAAGSSGDAEAAAAVIAVAGPPRKLTLRDRLLAIGVEESDDSITRTEASGHLDRWGEPPSQSQISAAIARSAHSDWRTNRNHLSGGAGGSGVISSSVSGAAMLAYSSLYREPDEDALSLNGLLDDDASAPSPAIRALSSLSTGGSARKPQINARPNAAGPAAAPRVLNAFLITPPSVARRLAEERQQKNDVDQLNAAQSSKRCSVPRIVL